MKRSTLLKTAALLFCLAASTGCARWEDMSSWANTAVWSDDGQKVATAKLFYEGKDVVTHTKKRGFELQLYTSSKASPNKLTALTPVLEGNLHALYFMRSSNYIVVGRILDGVTTNGGSTSGSTRRTITFERVSLDGSTSLIDSVDELTMLSCDGGQSATSTGNPLSIIPSPDGSTLAVVKTVTDCASTTTTVAFRDAATLSIIDGPKTVDLNALVGGSLLPNAPLAMFLLQGWSDDGKFLITNAGTPDGAWAYKPGQNVEWRTGVDDGCMFPSTTSSETSDQKQVLEVDYNHEGQSPISIVSDPDANTFGCP